MNFDREPNITITTQEYRDLISADVFRQLIINAYHTRKYDSDVIDIIKAFIGKEPDDA